MKDYKLSTQLKMYGIYSGMLSFSLLRGVFLIYLAFKGLDIFQVALYQSVFFISSSILEIPTGYVGDKFGHKKSVMLGTIFLGITTVFTLLNDVVYIFYILASMEALSFALISGSDKAILYELLKKYKCEDQYLKTSNVIMAVGLVSQGTAIILGGFLASISWNIVYMLTAFICFFSVIPLMFVKVNNVVVHKVKEEKQKKITEYLLYPSTVIFIVFVIVTSLYDGMFVCYYNFNQIILTSYGLSIAYVGVFFSVICFLTAVAYLLVNKLVEYFNRKQIFIYTLFISGILFLALAFTKNLVIVVILSIIISVVPEIMYTVSESIIQDYIDSSYRATILSMVSFVRTIAASLLYIVFGYLFKIISFNVVFIYISITIFVGVISSAFVYYKLSIDDSIRKR